ncbi:SPFH domain-containing protein [Nocardia sp. 2]|uniref:SPFH domain-containing protein n=1 Tax=Nocardia acididurans TaxID=2802282 RepID=A0ABS1MGK2_9NOCA|nr:SPFH domain-containing protein [Nocardia acididurans]MBL1079788.1 SPFH domain-containing protein [Nocardia acididurans]
MAWFAREFISVPDDRKDQVVFKWPDRAIRHLSRVVVDADETALFVRSGAVIATLGPGRHRIDAEALPGLGAVVDTLTGGNYYRAELYFVASREFTGIPFGGRLTDITDPVSHQVVSLRAYGEFALTVRDAARLIVSLVGTADLADARRIREWSAALLLKSLKVAVARGIAGGEWSVLGVSAQLPVIETAVVADANRMLFDYGLRIARLGDLDITLVPEDSHRLKQLAKDRTYIDLVGDFQRYAAGELALGAGAGMAAGSPGADARLATGLGFAALQQFSPAPPPWHETTPVPVQHDQVCGACGAHAAPHARFCAECGAGLGARVCAQCGAGVAARARFCAACGHPTNEDAPTG